MSPQLSRLSGRDCNAVSPAAQFINPDDDFTSASADRRAMRILSRLRTRSTSTGHDERGFSLVEYSIVTAGIAVVVIAGVAVLGGAILALFDFPIPF